MIIDLRTGKLSEILYDYSTDIAAVFLIELDNCLERFPDDDKCLLYKNSLMLNSIVSILAARIYEMSNENMREYVDEFIEALKFSINKLINANA